jgi:hypothetical protein
MMNPHGLYIYGIIPVYYPAEKFRELDNLNVFNIPYGKVSAIVSQSIVIDYRLLGTEPLAKLLIEHQKTIESIMNLGFTTIIPMQIGTFANNTSEVIRILEKGYDLIMDILGRIANLTEADIVSTWADFNKLLLDISADPRVSEMKNRICESNTVTQSDQLTIGYLVKKILDEIRQEYSSKIIESLSPFCENSRQHEILNDNMVANTAFLISHNRREQFEHALDKLDSELNGKINFKLVGPLPCYSFYTLEAKELHFHDIEEAKNELGLNSRTSEKLIKQAYHEKIKKFHPDVNPGEINMIGCNRVHKAYETLMDYAKAVRTSTQDDQFSLLIDKVVENSMVIKIRA